MTAEEKNEAEKMERKCGEGCDVSWVRPGTGRLTITSLSECFQNQCESISLS